MVIVVVYQNILFDFLCKNYFDYILYLFSGEKFVVNDSFVVRFFLDVNEVMILYFLVIVIRVEGEDWIEFFQIIFENFGLDGIIFLENQVIVEYL